QDETYLIRVRLEQEILELREGSIAPCFQTIFVWAAIDPFGQFVGPGRVSLDVGQASIAEQLAGSRACRFIGGRDADDRVTFLEFVGRAQDLAIESRIEQTSQALDE